MRSRFTVASDLAYWSRSTRATPGTQFRTNTARARAPGPTPRLDEVCPQLKGRGKTASAAARELTRALELRRVGADRNSPAMADADATELQGNREALGGNVPGKREKSKRRQPDEVNTPKTHLDEVNPSKTRLDEAD